jgi:hypothetical protein
MRAAQFRQAREQALLRKERQHIEVQPYRRVGTPDLADNAAQLVEDGRQLVLQVAPCLGQSQPMVMPIEQRSTDGML